MPANLPGAAAHLASMKAKAADATDYVDELEGLLEDTVGVNNEYGTAATRDAGAAAGNVPLLDAAARLAPTTLPPGGSFPGVVEAEAQWGAADDSKALPNFAQLLKMLRWQTIEGETLIGDPATTNFQIPITAGAGAAVDLNGDPLDHRSLTIRYQEAGSAVVKSLSVPMGPYAEGDAARTIASVDGPPAVDLTLRITGQHQITLAVSGGAAWTLLSVEGVNPEIGSFDHTYLSLADLPSAARLPIGTKATVCGPLGVRASMVFRVENLRFGARRWECVGGSSNDLVSANQIITGGNQFVDTRFNLFNVIPTHFPFLLLNFGATVAGGFKSAHWHRVERAQIGGLARAAAGDEATAATGLRLVDNGTTYTLGFSGANNLMVATDDAAKDILPLKVRGSA